MTPPRTCYGPDWIAVEIKLEGRLVRCIVPYEFDWGRYHRIDVTTWLGGYRT